MAGSPPNTRRQAASLRTTSLEEPGPYARPSAIRGCSTRKKSASVETPLSRSARSRPVRLKPLPVKADSSTVFAWDLQSRKSGAEIDAFGTDGCSSQSITSAPESGNGSGRSTTACTTL